MMLPSFMRFAAVVVFLLVSASLWPRSAGMCVTEHGPCIPPATLPPVVDQDESGSGEDCDPSGSGSGSGSSGSGSGSGCPTASPSTTSTAAVTSSPGSTRPPFGFVYITQTIILSGVDNETLSVNIEILIDIFSELLGVSNSSVFINSIISLGPDRVMIKYSVLVLFNQISQLSIRMSVIISSGQVSDAFQKHPALASAATVSASEPSVDNNGGDSDSNSDDGWIAGAVVGAVVGACLIAVVAFVVVRSRSRSYAPHGSESHV